MNLIEIYDTLLAGDGHFTTREVVQKTGISPTQASKMLAKLTNLGQVIRITRGKWVLLSKATRLRIPELLASSPTYCTAHTALFHHEMIEQIPTAIHAVTTSRGRNTKTPFGPVQIHQISPQMFQGWQSEKHGAKIATPEKALVDYFYIGLKGHPHFKTLPEVKIPKGFCWEKAKAFTQNIPNKAWRSALQSKLLQQKRICELLANEDSAEK